MLQSQELIAKLTPADGVALRTAQLCFLCAITLPPTIYYSSMGPDDPPAFPASISYTIRKGRPYSAFSVLWPVGWALKLQVVYRLGSVPSRIFFTQMFATGVVLCLICTIGSSDEANGAHDVAALFYMVDHFVALWFDAPSGTARGCKALMIFSFVVLVAAVGQVLTIEEMHGVPHENAVGAKAGFRFAEAAERLTTEQYTVWWSWCGAPTYSSVRS